MQGVVSPVQQQCFPVMHVCSPDAHEAVSAHDLHEGGQPNKDPSCRELLRPSTVQSMP